MIYTTIDTFYLTDEQLANSPSRKNGVDQRTETMLRIYGCELIQEAGILLKLPQAVMATAQVIFQRFYCKKSFTVYNVKRTAASCVWLAAKLEESQRKIRDVLNVFNRMEQRRENLPLEPLDPLSKKYEELKLDLIRTERHILKEMGFICHVEHPHKFILYYLNSLGASSELMQQVWNLANDSLRTTLCVRFKGEVVACGVIYAAARRARVPLPENPQWWLVFNAKKEDVVCRELALLYSYPRAEYIEVCKDQKSFVLSTRAWNPPAPVQELNARRQQANGTTSSSVMQANGAQGNSFRGMDVGNSVQPAPVSTIRESAVPSMPVATANGHNTVKGEFVKGESGKGLVDSRKELSEREGERHRERGREREKEKERSKEREREWERDRDREHVRDREREREHRERQRPRDERARGRPEKAREVIPSREHSSYGAFREKRNHRHHPYDKTNLKAAAS